MDSIIEECISLHREILDNFARNVGQIDDKEFKEKFVKYYGFENSFNWNVLMNSLYIFEDTELAKASFKRFMLQGPSRHEDVGERYLRLYGFLNLIYLQKNSVENLIEIFKVPNLKDIKKELNNLKLIDLRNKVASHPSNYISDRIETENKFFVYEISRYDLIADKILLLRDQEKFEEYDLDILINEFNKIIENLLNLTLTKFIKKKFKNQGEFYKKLLLIQAKIEGNIVMGDIILKVK